MQKKQVHHNIQPHSRIAQHQQFFNALFKCAVLIAATLLISCAHQTTEKEVQRTEHAYFITAQRALKAKNYLLAIEQLQKLESRFPFGRYASQVQLDLIYAYYQSMDYDNARIAAKRFIRLNPKHPELDYAHYMEALSAFDVDRGFLARILPSSPAERDLYPLYDAFTLFSRFINEHPNSEYSLDAKQRMVYIRNLLADHELSVANYYMQRRAYLSAANRGRYIVENFPKTPAVEQALEYMIRGYRELQLSALAAAAESTLIANYPDNKNIQMGRYAYEREIRNDERSWLNILTFGLLGKNSINKTNTY